MAASALLVGAAAGTSQAVPASPVVSPPSPSPSPPATVAEERAEPGTAGERAEPRLVRERTEATVAEERTEVGLVQERTEPGLIQERAEPIRVEERTERFGSPADSSDLRSDARSAQARFERLRVRHLPWAWGSGFGGRCDERLGRMCLRHGSGSLWEPAEEAPETKEAREQLLETLAAVGREIPGDDWVLGQRVKYLGEAERWSEAEELARRCGGASGWWCDALLGYVLHETGRFAEAADAFEDALAAMDGEREGDWRNLERLVDRDGYRLLRDAEGEDLRLLEKRIWVLGNPLFLQEGNDRRTAHFARHVESRMREGARNPYNLRWGRDLAEIHVRYGAEYGWEKERPRPGQMGPPPIIGRFHPRSRGFLPPGEYVRDPAGIPAGEWDVDGRRERARYAPPYSPRIMTMAPQVAVFPRGDSAAVVAAWELPDWREYDRADPEPPPDGPFEAGLFLVPVPGEDGATANNGASLEAVREGAEIPSVTGRRDRRGALHAVVPAGRYLLSLEALQEEEQKAWRARQGLELEAVGPGRVVVSDLLLVSAADERAERLDDVVPRALPRPEIEEGGAAGVAWEVYGLQGEAETVRFRVTVEQEDRGLMRRLGERLRILDAEPPVVVTWSESGPDEPGPFFRSVALDLQGLDEGVYDLVLEAEAQGRSPVTSHRQIRIVEGGS